VVDLSQNDVTVACGSGALRLQRITVEGDEEDAPKSVIKSLKIRLR
jgi:methionyl-tRNA formyltransferase